MKNITDKNKPYPENKTPENTPTGPKRTPGWIWNTVLFLALVALLVWLFAFT